MSDKFEQMKAKMAAMRSSSRKSVKRGEISKMKKEAGMDDGAGDSMEPAASSSTAESILSPRQSAPAAAPPAEKAPATTPAEDDKYEQMKAKMAAMRSSSRKSLKRGEVGKMKGLEVPPSSASTADSIISPRQSTGAGDGTGGGDDDDDFSTFSIKSPRGGASSAGADAGAGGSGPNGEMTKKEKMKARSSLKKLEAMKLKVALMREEKGDGEMPSMPRKNARKSLPMAWASEVKKDTGTEEAKAGTRASVKFPLPTGEKGEPLSSLSPQSAGGGDQGADEEGEVKSPGGSRIGSKPGSRIGESGSANDRVEEMKKKMADVKARKAFVPRARDDSTGRTSIRRGGTRGAGGEAGAAAEAKEGEETSGQGGGKMALAANKFAEMKKRTEERRRRKEEQKKRREGKRKALGSQLESFLSIVTNLEPMLKKLEAEKALREAEMHEAQREMKLMRQAATANQSNISLLTASMNSLLEQDREKVSIDYIFRELEGMRATLGAVSAVYDHSLHAEPVTRDRLSSVADIVKERKRQRSVCADAPPSAASLAPPPPPMPAAPGMPPPPPKMKPSKLKLPTEVCEIQVESAAPASRGDLLAQIRKTALRKLDMEQVEQERAAAGSTDKEGALFSSLAETVKMALDIRKKAMEADESDEEDWSDDDELDGEWESD
eukprot:TRINITY_DN7801_c0_g1_i2.p1 TRINITY_DN7801_c0_g1~~TRINITY_DN7801_c0_g1_i2.p1  ORF type:complete len:753 (-),score=236.66 TRINITY_DN7801_c0_g1_i2:105-2099(-)